MRQLRFVRADGQLLVLESADPVEQFVISAAEVPAPAPLVAPRVTAPARGATPAAPEPTLVPREIQMRVRAGESPADLAASLGTTPERIMRFAGPVMDERRRIADEARRARARRSNSDGADGAVVIFGEAVDQRFGAHGIVAADVAWDARRRPDGEWLVTAEWLGGESRHSAEWLFHRGTRMVTPVEDAASDLLSDRPIRPMMPAEPARPTLAAAPPLAEGPRELPPLVPAASALHFDEPPLPLGITMPLPHPSALDRLTNRHAAKRDESDDERAARARVPSWDDILLGVRRKQD